MFSFLIGVVFGLSFSITAFAGEPKKAMADRNFAFTYSFEVPAGLAQGKPLDVFVPLASSDEYQEVLERRIESPVAGTIKTEKVYGNDFWHATVKDAKTKPLRIVVHYRLRRKAVRVDKEEAQKSRWHTDEERKALALFLKANKRVPIDGEMITKIIATLPKNNGKPWMRARAIYDYVIDNMEYKKVGTGWGNGDTYWACSEKYGNCTDFHALFTSLARSEKLPVRFEIGFPIPPTSTGTINGYHCWAMFHLPQTGWIPIDASEAKKHPERREYFFAGQPSDRIRLSVGRDLQLGEGHHAGPLNYFVFPHIETGGKRLDASHMRFTFADF